MPLNVQPDAVKREASRLFREDGIVVEPTHHKENTEKEDSCRTSEGKSVWNACPAPAGPCSGRRVKAQPRKETPTSCPPEPANANAFGRDVTNATALRVLRGRKRDPRIAWVTCVLTGGSSGGGGEAVCRRGEDPVTRLQAGD